MTGVFSANHYINDVQNNIEISYYDECVLVRLTIPTIEDAEEFMEELDMAIKKWKMFGEGVTP